MEDGHKNQQSQTGWELSQCRTGRWISEYVRVSEGNLETQEYRAARFRVNNTTHTSRVVY